MDVHLDVRIPKFPHLIGKCVEAGDIDRLQQIESNTQEMISNGLDRETWEQYLRRVRDAKELIVEKLLWVDFSVANRKDN